MPTKEINIWKMDRSAWPFDVPSQVFIGNAVLALGKAMFPGAWTDADPSSTAPKLRQHLLRFESLESARIFKLRTAADILRNAGVTGVPLEIAGGYGGRLPTIPLSEAQWEQAQQLEEDAVAAANVALQRQIDLAAEASSRSAEAKAAFHQHCIFSRLKTFVQWHDGSFVPLPAERWNFRERTQWMESGSAPTTAFMHVHPLAHVGEHWLFVDRADLEKLTETVDRTPKTFDEKKAWEWAQPIFDAATAVGKANITQDQFEKEAKIRFPTISIPKLRETVWDNRPSVYPRKAPRER